MTAARRLAAILAADVVGFSGLAERKRIGRWRGSGGFGATSIDPLTVSRASR
jgi:hypothetical protein